MLKGAHAHKTLGGGLHHLFKVINMAANTSDTAKTPIYEKNSRPLPSYDMVQYEPMTKMILPSVKFSDIYSYMTREKHDEDGKRCHRLLDRAVAHFQAGDRT